MKNFLYFVNLKQTDDELFEKLKINNIKKNMVKTSVIGKGPFGETGTMFTLKDSDSNIGIYDKDKQKFEKVFEIDSIKLYIGYWLDEFDNIALDDLIKKDINIEYNEVTLLNDKKYKVPSILSIPFSYNYVDSELIQVPSKKYKYLNDIAFKYDEYSQKSDTITITYAEIFDDCIELLKCFYNTNKYELLSLDLLDTEVSTAIIKAFMEFEKRAKMWEEYYNKIEAEKKI